MLVVPLVQLRDFAHFAQHVRKIPAVVVLPEEMQAVQLVRPNRRRQVTAATVALVGPGSLDGEGEAHRGADRTSGALVVGRGYCDCPVLHDGMPGFLHGGRRRALERGVVPE